jgi:hypothetical protein
MKGSIVAAVEQHIASGKVAFLSERPWCSLDIFGRLFSLEVRLDDDERELEAERIESTIGEWQFDLPFGVVIDISVEMRATTDGTCRLQLDLLVIEET